MTKEQLEKLREKYKSIHLGKSWSDVQKFVSGAYQDVKDLLDEVDRVSAERDKAVADAKRGQTCKSCRFYKEGCAPLRPDTGCKSWQWRGMEGN